MHQFYTCFPFIYPVFLLLEFLPGYETRVFDKNINSQVLEKNQNSDFF